MASHGPAGALPAAALDVKPDWQVLDTGLGARNAHAGVGAAIRLAMRIRLYHCRVVGIDAVGGPMIAAGAGIFAQTRIEAIPARAATFDLVWWMSTERWRNARTYSDPAACINCSYER
jgi:hypothetical protein